MAEAVVTEEGAIKEIKILHGGEKYGQAPSVLINNIDAPYLDAVVKSGKIESINILSNQATNFDPSSVPVVSFVGGNQNNHSIAPGDVGPVSLQIRNYHYGNCYGYICHRGGLKAVIITDVIQSVLLLLAGLLVAFITFSQLEIGGWNSLMERDLGTEGVERFHLYNSSNHPALPWTGVLSGLMILHFYYWGTNQFIVQRALSATTDKEAKWELFAAGFFKLLIPFFSIGTGVAAYYLFKDRNLDVAQDAVFIKLLTELISPIDMVLLDLLQLE